MITSIVHNTVYKIGQNAHENWDLISKAKPFHFFFHLRSFPSCYVILECEDTPEIETIYAAAKLCKDRTKYKKIPDIYVDYCRCDNLRKTWKVGEVEYKSNKRVLKVKV